MTMTTAPPAVACLSSSLSSPSRSSPSSSAVAASSAWVPVIFLAWTTSCLYHSQANDPARVRRMTPIITAFKSVRRHLIGKCSRPLQGVALPDGAHLFFLTFPEERVASIPSSSYKCIYTLHAQRAVCILRMSVFGALFTQVRGIGILGSSYPRSCIAPPRHPWKQSLQAPYIAPLRYRL